MKKSKILTEGKHWPADYIKTGINMVKASQLGQQSWYNDSFIQQDMQTFADEFGPLSHKNSNLGFFSTIVRWFIEYSGTSKEKYQEFIERKLDGIIGTLQLILNDPSYDKIKDDIKTKWSFSQFEELQKKINDEARASSDEKLKNIVKKDDYDLISIYSYEELNEKFGGRWTGYKGQSEWCHANGKSTYDSWTKNGTQMFFVLARKGWKEIKAPDPKTTNAYDEYGISLIAILVDVATGNLLNETLRWNHVIDPSITVAGATVDKAFKNSWGELSQTIGMDVKAEVIKQIKDKQDEIKDKQKNANEEVARILKNAKIITNVTIPENICKLITDVVVPNSVEDIGDAAFSHCKSLESILIPDSVEDIGNYAFYKCKSLKTISIPNSVKSIGDEAFYGCTSFTNISIPNSVESIGSHTFFNCTSLENISIPNSVESIGNGAFSDCTSLESITIPDSIKSIGDYAFSYCKSLKIISIPNSVERIGDAAFFVCTSLKEVIFEGKTIEEVKNMEHYPFGIEDESIIKVEKSLNENKATYIRKYEDEPDVNTIVDMFWAIRQRLSAPQNDIDWWIKKPFEELKRFVQNFDPSNKKQRRESNYKQQAIDNGAKLLDTKDGYEIWYVPTYEAMTTLGRFYKGRSAKWCVASDDPEFWYDNHDEDEFLVLIREHPKNDEFDKVAIQMEHHGRYYNEDDIIPWDLENDDWTFTNDELIHYAWQLFKDNGELRDQYYDIDDEL